MSATSASAGNFGPVLRDCRRARKLSQLDLALDAQVSQRHLSFLESGRARPSREMVLALARALDLPLRDRNVLLKNAGFVDAFGERRLDADEMAPAREALQHMLRHHEPYPAVVLDRSWNLILQNTVVPRIFGLLGDLDQVWSGVCGTGPRNLLKLCLHPAGLRPYIVNLEEIAPHLLARTAHEALTHAPTQALLDEVMQYPDLPRSTRQLDVTTHLPVLATHFRIGAIELKLFSMLSTFGTPLDVTTDELRVESFFPADVASEALLRGLAGS